MGALSGVIDERKLLSMKFIHAGTQSFRRSRVRKGELGGSQRISPHTQRMAFHKMSHSISGDIRGFEVRSG